MVLPAKENKGFMPTKKCPFCSEEIHEKAFVCKHCCRDLDKRSSGYGKVVKFGYLGKLK